VLQNLLLQKNELQAVAHVSLDGADVACPGNFVPAEELVKAEIGGPEDPLLAKEAKSAY
jgi:hypothetical protein